MLRLRQCGMEATGSDLVYHQASQQSSAMQVSQQIVKGGALYKLFWRDVQQLAGGHGLVQLSEHS